MLLLKACWVAPFFSGKKRPISRHTGSLQSGEETAPPCHECDRMAVSSIKPRAPNINLDLHACARQHVGPHIHTKTTDLPLHQIANTGLGLPQGLFYETNPMAPYTKGRIQGRQFPNTTHVALASRTPLPNHQKPPTTSSRPPAHPDAIRSDARSPLERIPRAA